MAEQIRYRVRMETQLTCSVGLGPNTMLAKVASDINKPNGQYALPEDPAAIKEFVQSLSLRKVPGIGKVRLLWWALVCLIHADVLFIKERPLGGFWLACAHWVLEGWSRWVVFELKLLSTIAHMAFVCIC